MKFTPKSKEDIQADKLIPVGVYSFEIDRAEDKISKKGAEMIELNLSVFDHNGNRRQIRDWVGSWNGGEEKLLGLCESTGLPYTGQLDAAELPGLSGYLKIGIQDNPQYGKQNTVKIYVPEDKVKTTTEREQTKLSDAQDVELPF